MNCLPQDPLLQFNSDTLEQIRKLYDLDNAARLEEAIQLLENWVEKQNHFTQKKFDRAYLERVLILSKGSVEKAKSQLDYMCTLRSLLPKYFVHCNVKEDLKSILDMCWIIPLPKMTKDHNRVYVFKINTSAIKPGDISTFCRFVIISCEYLKSHDYLKGIILIEDFRNVNLLDFLSKLSLTEMQEMVTIVIKGFGARLQEIHVINESNKMMYFIQFAKHVLSQKLVSRIKSHHDAESVHEYIDPSILPVEFGGTERSLDTIRSEWIDCLSSEDHIEYVRKMNQARTDEALRLGDKFNSLYMGTSGSFRNLAVD